MYKPQKRQDVSDFALTYSLRLRSCKSLDNYRVVVRNGGDEIEVGSIGV
jgi:hypothetical protein